MCDEHHDNEEIPASILGKNLGTASGWDQTDLYTIQFYDFKPNDRALQFCPKLAGMADHNGLCIGINFETGVVELFSDDVELFRTEVKWGALD